MFSFILTILAPFLALVGGLSSSTASLTATPTPSSSSDFWQASCYQVESSVTLSVTKEDLDRVEVVNPAHPLCYGTNAPIDPPNGLIGDYTLIRRGVELIPFKVEKEGAPYNGRCELGSAIRIVGEKEDGTVIYWEPSNYKEQDIRQFVEVFRGKNGKNYVFDIYARDTILDNLPDYITNCVESGGLVPVTEENTNIVPPQSIPLKDVIKDEATNPYFENYEKFLLEDPDSFPPNGNFIVKISEQNIPKPALKGDAGKFGEYETTINGTGYIYEIYFHVGAFYIRDKNSKESWVYGVSAEEPPTLSGRDPSLQLKVLRFRVVDSWTVFTPVCKPAIYLYPEKETALEVQVSPKGELTTTIPEYGSGWNIVSFPDGRLKTDGQSYPYLYYEANLNDGYKPKEGWIISLEEREAKLSDILKSLGLNEKERADFLDYWLPRLTSKPYYFVGFVPLSEIEEKEKLTLSENPDTILRVRLIFEGLDAPVSVPAPILQATDRKGFVLVDWGGSVIGESCEGTAIY
ncbi:hypothetical protein HYW55_00115 [Candidatus Gottesmanbacteria bacterium]|nr:hypothetical protein [Candidatus Gottesmanbacteria bacterium]